MRIPKVLKESFAQYVPWATEAIRVAPEAAKAYTAWRLQKLQVCDVSGRG